MTKDEIKKLGMESFIAGQLSGIEVLQETLKGAIDAICDDLKAKLREQLSDSNNRVGNEPG